MEDVLFFKSHRQRLNKQIAEVELKIGTKKIKFNKETICWLGVWLNNQLKFHAHINEKFQKATTVKIQIKGLMQAYRLESALI